MPACSQALGMLTFVIVIVTSGSQRTRDKDRVIDKLQDNLII
jgi:hypothetical protein